MVKRQRFFGSLLLIIAFLSLAVSCHKKQVAAPPPPAPAPAPPPPLPVATLSAEPATVEKGHTVTLRWSSENATTLDLQPQVGAVQATGSTTLTPEDSTTYVLTATGAGGTATANARVTVVPPPPPPPPPPAATKVEVTEEQLFDTQIKDAYFDFDKSDIRADAQQALTADGEFFKTNPEITFTIEGHCDERGSEEYNMGLGERRALAAKNFLVNLGVKPERVFTISFGKGRPTCTESTEECWQKNRRGHFKFGR